MCKFKCLNQKFVTPDTVYLVTILNLTSAYKCKKHQSRGKIFNGEQLKFSSVTHTYSFRWLSGKGIWAILKVLLWLFWICAVIKRKKKMKSQILFFLFSSMKKSFRFDKTCERVNNDWICIFGGPAMLLMFDNFLLKNFGIICFWHLQEIPPLPVCWVLIALLTCLAVLYLFPTKQRNSDALKYVGMQVWMLHGYFEARSFL